MEPAATTSSSSSSSSWWSSCWPSSWSRWASVIPRLVRDRAFRRSTVEAELTSQRDVSKAEMKQELTAVDMVWFGIGGIIGAGVFVITGVASAEYAGPAVLLSYFIAGLSALLSSFCYTEFAIDMPVAGGAFSYILVTFGEFPAWITVSNLLMEYVLSGAAVARSFTSYFATLCGQSSNSFRIQTSLLSLDIPAVLLISALALMLCLSTKTGSKFNVIITGSNVVVIVFVVIAGMTKAKVENFTPFAPFGVRGVFNAASLVFFSFIGFDSVATMAEEVQKPSRDLPIGIIGSVLITSVLYASMCIVISLMVPYSSINTQAPFSVAFASVGMRWASYIVSLGAVLGIVTSLLVILIGQARVLIVVGRAGLLPNVVARIDERRGTPVVATVMLSSLSGIIALFTSLDVLGKMVSIGTLLVFFMVAAAVLYRRYYAPGIGESPRPALLHLAWIVLSAMGLALYYQTTDDWIGLVVFFLSWATATASLQYFCPPAYTPLSFATPLMPWLPSASMLLNVFLLATLDAASYWRFAVWTALSVAVYVVYSVPAATRMEANARGEPKELELTLERDDSPLIHGPRSTTVDRIENGGLLNAKTASPRRAYLVRHGSSSSSLDGMSELQRPLSSP
eukprot:jgi/Chlat1/3219/Chrsp22S03500